MNDRINPNDVWRLMPDGFTREDFGTIFEVMQQVHFHFASHCQNSLPARTTGGCDDVRGLPEAVKDLPNLTDVGPVAYAFMPNVNWTLDGTRLVTDLGSHHQEFEVMPHRHQRDRGDSVGVQEWEHTVTVQVRGDPFPVLITLTKHNRMTAGWQEASKLRRLKRADLNDNPEWRRATGDDVREFWVTQQGELVRTEECCEGDAVWTDKGWRDWDYLQHVRYYREEKGK